MKRRCANPDCGQEFSINEHFQCMVPRDDSPEQKMRQYRCPYCGRTQGGENLPTRSGQGYTAGDYVDPFEEANRGLLIAASVIEWRHPGSDQSRRRDIVREFTSDEDNISGSMGIDRHGRIWIEARYGCRPDITPGPDIREFRAVVEPNALIEGFMNAIRGQIEPVLLMDVNQGEET